jgi:hypothetical protein
MTLKNFLSTYGRNACISIKGYCEEASYDEMFFDITEESWWNEVKNRKIKHWNIIGGGAYKVELTIELEKKTK